MENLKIISIIQKHSKHYGVVDGRNSCGFSIRTKGALRYDFPDRSILVGEGEMIFLPKGAHYTYTKMSDEESFGTIINVEGDFGKAEPFFCPIKDFCDAEYIMHHVSDLWNFGTPAGKYQVLSLFFGLLAYVSNLDSLDYGDKKKFTAIEKSVKYLQTHLFDPDLKIEDLHKLSAMSDTYFRKIFTARFGKSPKNYVIEKRVSYAKSIIDSGEAVTVKDLAESVGYRDPLYFGKVYKKRYGTSPVNSF